MVLPHDPVVAPGIGLIKHHRRLLRLWPIGKMLLRLGQNAKHREDFLVVNLWQPCLEHRCCFVFQQPAEHGQLFASHRDRSASVPTGFPVGPPPF